MIQLCADAAVHHSVIYADHHSADQKRINIIIKLQLYIACGLQKPLFYLLLLGLGQLKGCSDIRHAYFLQLFHLVCKMPENCRQLTIALLFHHQL